MTGGWTVGVGEWTTTNVGVGKATPVGVGTATVVTGVGGDGVSSDVTTWTGVGECVGLAVSRSLEHAATKTSMKTITNSSGRKFPRNHVPASIDGVRQ